MGPLIVIPNCRLLVILSQGDAMLWMSAKIGIVMIMGGFMVGMLCAEMFGLDQQKWYERLIFTLILIVMVMGGALLVSAGMIAGIMALWRMLP